MPPRKRAPAHWLAHELRSKAPAGVGSCAFGHPLDVDDVLFEWRRVVPLTPLAMGDVSVDLDACGVVVGVGRKAGPCVLMR